MAFLIPIVDLLALVAAFVGAHWLADYVRPVVGAAPGNYHFSEIPEVRWLIFSLIAFAFVAWCGVAKGHFTRRRPFWDELQEILAGLCVAALLDAALMYMAKLPFSRVAWMLAWGLALLAVPMLRRLARAGLRRFGFWDIPTLIVGTGDNAVDAVHALRSDPTLGYRLRGLVTVGGIEAPRAAELLTGERLERYGDIEALSTLGRSWSGWQLVLALEPEQMAAQPQLIHQLTQLDANLVVAPPLRGLPLYGTDTSYFFSHEVLLLRVRNNLARRGPQLAKRLFDIVAVLAGLAVLSPFLLALAWGIRRDGGPAIFKHTRIGRNGREFKCYKFRSMVIDADQRLKALLASSAEARAEWERDHKLRDDPRVTALGRFIRKTSVDELPQLLNVLRGEMSLVGPRPIVEAEKAKYGDHLRYYLEARPGVTGLWQVSGRNDTDYSRRVMLDTWYVQNWSLWNDIVILFKTVRVVLGRDGAY